jgi:hypothetical protein
VEHYQRRRIGIADDYKMQSYAINIEELADRGIAPARDELARDVANTSAPSSKRNKSSVLI